MALNEAMPGFIGYSHPGEAAAAQWFGSPAGQQFVHTSFINHVVKPAEELAASMAGLNTPDALAAQDRAMVLRARADAAAILALV